MKDIDFAHIGEDEESEYISAEIAKLKAQGLTNNIDFEKAELERQELENKLGENENLVEENFEQKNSSTSDEELSF